MKRRIWAGFVVIALVGLFASVGLSLAGMTTPVELKVGVLVVGAVAMAGLMTAMLTGDFPG